MTPQDMEAEIRRLRDLQAAQRKLWLRWGYGSVALALAIFAAIGVKMLQTGADPDLPMLFIDLIFVFVGTAFLTVGRDHAHPARS